MKIYYLKYYKGAISIKEEDIARRFYNGTYVPDVPVVIQGLDFDPKDEGEILEYSLGDIRIWITEKGNLELVYKKLNDYVENFHHKNIKMYIEKIKQEGEYLNTFYEESMNAYLDGIYKYYNINKKEK